MRDTVMKAIVAEVAPVSVWQRFILQAMTVFHAKNAYGKGSTWAEHGALAAGMTRPVSPSPGATATRTSA